MHHSEKKNSDIFSPEGPCKNVWGPRKKVSSGPAVSLNRPGKITPTTIVSATISLLLTVVQLSHFLELVIIKKICS